MNTKRVLLKAMGMSALFPAVTTAHASSETGARSGYFPNPVLQTQEGKNVRFYDDLLKGKTVIINMMYTTCTRTCPPNTANLRNVQNALGERVGKDIFIYSLTLQPEIDTPAALLEYAQMYGVKPGWTFLTGKRADMDVLRRKLGFYDRDPARDSDLARHSGMLRIGSEAKDRWFMAPAVTPTQQIVSSVLNL